jgi:hypothetical protein
VLFTYLGVFLADGKRAVETAMPRNFSKAKQVAQMMFRRCYSMGIHSVFMQCRLFDALARPVLNYGCELWGPYAMMRANVARGMDSEVELWHRAILRQMLGVRKSVPIAVLMHETNRTPIHLSWLKQSLRFWNKVCSRPAHDLVRIAMQESLSMGTMARAGWVHTLNMALAKQGLDRVIDLSPVDVDVTMKLATQKWKDGVWGRLSQHMDVPVRAVGHWGC